MKLLTTALLLLLTLELAQAEPRRTHKREHHDWIIERQQSGQVSGVPILRRIIGGREIDIYRNGAMFEKNNLVGVSKH